MEQNVRLAPYTSWLVGGMADHFCLPRSVDDLRAALEFAQQKKLQVFVLGGGSNTLISDDGVRGLVICLKHFRSIETEIRDGLFFVKCLAGTGKNELLKVFLKEKLPPALFLAGLPGDVGGGIVMNAGVAENFLPREFGEMVDHFEVMKWDHEKIWTETFFHHDVKWAYRHSEGWGPGIIIRACLKWKYSPDATILEQVRKANHLRLSRQPLDKPSCGSVFVNPPGQKAAQLIDQAGLKGYQVGGAQVSLKHANFIVNLGGATAQDILSVMEHVQKVVAEKTGVQLKTEFVRVPSPVS